MTVSVVYGMFLLLDVAEDIQYEGNSYQKIIYLVSKSNIVVNVSISMMCVMQIMVSVGSCLFVIEVMNHIFCDIPVTEFCNQKIILTLIAFAVSAPTFFIKNLKIYSTIAFASTFTVLVLIGSLVFSSTQIMVKTGLTHQKEVQWLKIPSCIAVFTFALEGIALVLPVKNSMKEQGQFRRLSVETMIVVGLLYLIPPMIMSLALGPALKDIVILNFVKDYPFIFFLQIVYAAFIFLTFPINMFPIYTILLNSKVSKGYIHGGITKEDKDSRKKMVLIGARVLCLVTVFGIVLFHPNFVSFLSLVGAVLMSAFGFFFPVYLYNTHFGKTGRISTARLVSNYVFLSLMFVVCSLAVYDSIINLFKK